MLALVRRPRRSASCARAACARLLTAFGVVLGVGMVFGVLLLVGTIRHTFDDLIGSAWGKTDLVVIGPRTAACCPQSTLDRVRAVPGVRDARGRWSAASSRGSTRAGKPVKGRAGRDAGRRLRHRARTPPYDFRWLDGPPPRTGPEVASSATGRAQRGIAARRRAPRRDADRAGASCRVVGIFRFSSGLSFGGQGFAGDADRRGARR